MIPVNVCENEKRDKHNNKIEIKVIFIITNKKILINKKFPVNGNVVRKNNSVKINSLKLENIFTQ